MSGLDRITAAGVSFLRRAGSPGDTLVLLHGVGSDALSWAPVMRELDAIVLAWDAPGYGASAGLEGAPCVPDDYAEALERALDALQIGSAVIAGHSLGTVFAARYAVRFPWRVSALALLSPALGYRVPRGGALPPAVQARIDDLERMGGPAFAAARAPRLIHRPEAKPDLVAAVQRAMAALRPGGYAQAVHALGAGDLLADAARITAPTLVAVGAEDLVTPPANARAVHAALPNPLAMAELPDAGHALPQELPGDVARLLAPLLEMALHG